MIYMKAFGLNAAYSTTTSLGGQQALPLFTSQPITTLDRVPTPSVGVIFFLCLAVLRPLLFITLVVGKSTNITSFLIAFIITPLCGVPVFPILVCHIILIG